MKHSIPVLLAAVLLFAAGCSGNGTGTSEWDIEPDELHALIADHHGEYTLIDVRNPETEYEVSHIPTAVNYEVTVVEGWTSETVPAALSDRDQHIIVYCAAGARAARAKTALVKLGFTNVDNFGGISRWTGAGYPTESVTE